MATLLVITTGRTDVQLVIDGKRYELSSKSCGRLHDAIKRRSWKVVDAPNARSQSPIEELPEGDLLLCAPKLDAVLAHVASNLPTSALILETRRERESDPRHAGEFMECRLRSLGVEFVKRVPFLTGDDDLEGRSNDLDAVVRRSVVAKLSDAIARATADLKQDDRVFVATTGGFPAVNELINELVRLHCVGGPTVTALEVPDEKRTQQADRAVEEKFHPAAGYRARWHALSLFKKGSFIAAWGAVNHLERLPGQEWTQVVKWLYQFASSLPFEPRLPEDGALAMLKHKRKAVRAALRTELALCSGDIPRAVHGTVAFCEAALWDHLNERGQGTKHRFRFHEPVPSELVRETDCAKLAALSKKEQEENSKRPFTFKETADGADWYEIDDGAIRATKITKYYLKLGHLTTLAQMVDNNVRKLRNDVAHNEPTTDLMKDASNRMQAVGLWSNSNPPSFLSQPVIHDVLKELGIENPASLLTDLLTEVRRRLVAA